MCFNFKQFFIMLVKIMKQIFIFTFLPQGLFFYGFYFNDLFNLKQIANLSTEITEIKDLIQAQNEISNNKLENIKDVSSNSNNIGIYILTAIIIAGICYFGFNYFNNDSPAPAMIISEQVTEQNKTIANNINSSTLSAVRNQTTNSLDTLKVLKTSILIF